MGVAGQVWWLDLLLAGLVGGWVCGWFAVLRARKVHQIALDGVHQRCWAEQERWQAEHQYRLEQAEREGADRLARAEAAEQALAEVGQEHEQAIGRVRREMDAARAGYRQAEQGLCQQLLALDRQVAAERAAHRREVQALRMQCDELNERLAAERQAPRIEAEQHQQACESRDSLRQEVATLLDLLEQSDAAQAALQHRVAVLEQQSALGQRQLEEARQALDRERARAPQPATLARAALAAVGAARTVSPVEAGVAVLRPVERQPDSPPPDNLQAIQGIGAANEAWLHGCGVWYLWQIAGWKAEEQQWVAAHLPRFGRRVYRENWVGQARALLDGAHEEGPAERRQESLEVRRERRVYPACLPPGIQDRRLRPSPLHALAAAA